MRWRSPAGEGPRDAGTTLAEMLVALIVFAVFASFLATTVINVTRTVRVSAVRETTAQRASTVLQQLSKDLRTATKLGVSGSEIAFTTATANEVVFYSSVDPTIVRERLYVTAGGVLMRETKVPDAASTYPDLTYNDPGGTTTRQIGTTDLRTSDLFTYVLKGTTTKVTSVTGTPLREIDAVGLSVSVDPDGAGPQKAVLLTTTVRPYNLT